METKHHQMLSFDRLRKQFCMTIGEPPQKYRNERQSIDTKKQRQRRNAEGIETAKRETAKPHKRA